MKSFYAKKYHIGSDFRGRSVECRLVDDDMLFAKKVESLRKESRMNFSQAKVMAEKCMKKPFIFMTRKRVHMLSALIISAEKDALSEFKKSDKIVCPICGKGKPFVQRLLVGDNAGNCIGTSYELYCDFCHYSPSAESVSTIEEAVSNWDAAVKRIEQAKENAKNAEFNQQEKVAENNEIIKKEDKTK